MSAPVLCYWATGSDEILSGSFQFMAAFANKIGNRICCDDFLARHDRRLSFSSSIFAIHRSTRQKIQLEGHCRNRKSPIMIARARMGILAAADRFDLSFAQ